MLAFVHPILGTPLTLVTTADTNVHQHVRGEGSLNRVGIYQVKTIFRMGYPGHNGPVVSLGSSQPLNGVVPGGLQLLGPTWVTLGGAAVAQIPGDPDPAELIP
jgi:hypothetical protein